MQTSQLRPLGWALMRRKNANQSVKATWLGSAGAPPGCKPLGLLMRHKDANQSVTATWLGSADTPQGGSAAAPQLMRHKDASLHLTKKCSTGFQKAAQNLEQSNHSGTARHRETSARHDPGASVTASGIRPQRRPRSQRLGHRRQAGDTPWSQRHSIYLASDRET